VTKKYLIFFQFSLFHFFLAKEATQNLQEHGDLLADVVPLVLCFFVKEPDKVKSLRTKQGGCFS
jgi:hypothetical protein